jgi:hypothetical protein
LGRHAANKKNGGYGEGEGERGKRLLEEGDDRWALLKNTSI